MKCIRLLGNKYGSAVQFSPRSGPPRWAAPAPPCVAKKRRHRSAARQALDVCVALRQVTAPMPALDVPTRLLAHCTARQGAMQTNANHRRSFVRRHAHLLKRSRILLSIASESACSVASAWRTMSFRSSAFSSPSRLMDRSCLSSCTPEIGQQIQSYRRQDA